MVLMYLAKGMEAIFGPVWEHFAQGSLVGLALLCASTTVDTWGLKHY